MTSIPSCWAYILTVRQTDAIVWQGQTLQIGGIAVSSMQVSTRVYCALVQ